MIIRAPRVCKGNEWLLREEKLKDRGPTMRDYKRAFLN